MKKIKLNFETEISTERYTNEDEASKDSGPIIRTKES
jgi:hypothetical protein